MRRRQTGVLKSNDVVKIVCAIISVFFIAVQIISALRLEFVSLSTISLPKPKLPKTDVVSEGGKIGRFGEAVVGMLPKDLPFTVFLPSEEAFRRDLRLNPDDSSSYATLTRVLGFSAVARWISAADLGYGKEKIYESISGFNLYVSKNSKEMLVVNGVASEQFNLKIGNVVVYIMDGVIMDAEFEQSVEPEEQKR